MAWSTVASFGGGAGAYVVETTRRLVRRALDRRLVGLASESAFWLSLALLPLAAVSGMIAARLALSHGALPPVFRYLPAEVRHFLKVELAEVASYNNGQVAPLGAGVFVWLASTGVHAIFDAFEAECGARARPWWKKRLISIGCCLALAVGMGLIAFIGGGVDRLIAELADARPRTSSALDHATRFAFSAGVDLLLTLGLFAVGIDRRVRPFGIVPGALFAVTLHVATGGVYAAVVATLGDSSTYLAGLAVVAALMTAVFLYALSLLLGLGLNAVLAEHPYRPRPAVSPRGPGRQHRFATAGHASRSG